MLQHFVRLTLLLLASSWVTPSTAASIYACGEKAGEPTVTITITDDGKTATFKVDRMLAQCILLR